MQYMPYHYSTSELDLLMNAFWIVMTIGLVIGGLILLTFYIFSSIGIYTLAKRRGYYRPWLAWIPFARDYLLGGIADNIQFRKGKNSYLRQILLGLSIFYTLAYIAYAIQALQMIPEMLLAIFQGQNPTYGNSTMMMMGIGMFMNLLSLGYTVVNYLALYRVFQEYAGKNALLFLILSILFGIGPFFLFAIRNKPAASELPPPPFYGNPPYPGGPVPPQQPPYSGWR